MWKGPEIVEDWKCLLRGDSSRLAAWLRSSKEESRLGLCVVTILCGLGLYGATVGVWRAPEMSVFVSVKMPCIVFLTLVINGVLNGMLAQVLATGLSFLQTFRAILMSFAVFALILGSLAPVTLGMTLNLPGPGSEGADQAHRILLLTHTLLIAFGGIVATGKLLGILRHFSGNDAAAKRTLVALLAGNLFVGAQVGFILRPVFGSPDLKVEFLRSDAMSGNFYESVWWAINRSF